MNEYYIKKQLYVVAYTPCNVSGRAQLLLYHTLVCGSVLCPFVMRDKMWSSFFAKKTNKQQQNNHNQPEDREGDGNVGNLPRLYLA